MIKSEARERLGICFLMGIIPLSEDVRAVLAELDVAGANKYLLRKAAEHLRVCGHIPNGLDVGELLAEIEKTVPPLVKL